MGLADSLGEAGAASLRIAGQRLELAALDVEEELVHAGRFVAGALLTALLAALALAALGAAVVVLFWDSARLAAVAGVTLAYAAAAVLAARAWLHAWRSKPPFMAATVAELARDAEGLGRQRP